MGINGQSYAGGRGGVQQTLKKEKEKGVYLTSVEASVEGGGGKVLGIKGEKKRNDAEVREGGGGGGKKGPFPLKKKGVRATGLRESKKNRGARVIEGIRRGEKITSLPFRRIENEKKKSSWKLGG